MKITYKELHQSAPSIAALMGMKLKPRTALTMARVNKAVRSELETLEGMRQRLLKEHGAFLPSADAQKYAFPDGKEEAFTAAWNEALEAEIDLPFGDGIKFDDLGLPDIEPAILEPVMWLFADAK